MKKILFLMLAALGFVACGGEEETFTENTNDGNNNPPKEYLVSLGFSGEITDIEETPLSRATPNDLYGIQVYSSPATLDDYKPYAYGLFDNKESMIIKLLEGYKYKFVSTMIVDGKNRIYKDSQGEYWSPFSWDSNPQPINNSFIYSPDKENTRLSQGYAWIVDNADDFSYEMYDRPNVMRYCGAASDYKPSDNGSVAINMKKVYFGAKFVTEGLTDGTLAIKLDNAPEMFIEYPQTEVEDMFTFSNEDNSRNPEVWMTDDYSETFPVIITWNKADGATIPLINQNITFKRNKLTTITVKVKDSSVNNGVDITEEENEMQPGDDIVIDTSNPDDTEVDPNV